MSEKITKENLEAYQEFVRLKSSGKKKLPLASEREEIILNLLLVTSIIIALSSPMIISTIFPQIEETVTVIWFLVVIPFLVINLYISDRIIRRMNMKTFKKNYPNFDTTVDVKQVTKELEKYKELSKHQKKENEKYLLDSQKDFDKMSTKEKIDFLRQEKEFLEQKNIQDKCEYLEDIPKKQYVKTKF